MWIVPDLQSRASSKTFIAMILAVYVLLSYAPVNAADKALGKTVVLDFDKNVMLDKLRPLALIKKDEYETSAVFTKRACEATYKALGADNKRTLLIGAELMAQIVDGKLVRSSYNADKQEFFIGAEIPNHYLGDRARYEDEWKWAPHFDDHKTNGVQIVNLYTTNNTVEERAVVYWTTSSFSAHLAFIDSARVRLAVKREDAKQLANDLRLAVAVRLQAPCFVTGEGRKPPTIDRPRELRMREFGIMVAPRPEWILYRGSTMEVLKRGTFK